MIYQPKCPYGKVNTVFQRNIVFFSGLQTIKDFVPTFLLRGLHDIVHNVLNNMPLLYLLELITSLAVNANQ